MMGKWQQNAIQNIQITIDTLTDLPAYNRESEEQKKYAIYNLQRAQNNIKNL